MITSLGLGEYYKLERKSEGLFGKNTNFDCSLFDSEEFQQQFVIKESSDKHQASLYLSDLNCYACVWVCEKAIEKLYPGTKILLNLAQGSARLTYNPSQVQLSAIAKVLADLGHEPSPNPQSEKPSNLPTIRVAVAFFCLMNIMLLATADYLSYDLDGSMFFHPFRFISMVLAAVIVFFSGFSFFKNSWTALKNRNIDVDIPIALAILLAFGLSSYNTIKLSGDIYFDSIAAIVFLLLSGRALQKIAYDRCVRSFLMEKSQEVTFCRVIDEATGDISLLPNHQVKANTTLRLLPGDLSLSRSIVLNGQSEISLEFINGETEWIDVSEQDEIPSGALVGSKPMTVVTQESFNDSYLNYLQGTADELMINKGQLLTLSDKMSRTLVIGILSISTLIFLSFLTTDPTEGLQRAIATLLIACPCAFGLGFPLTIARAFQLGIKDSVIFKNQKALENLAKVKNIFFDKTGTLTSAVPKLKAGYLTEDFKHLETLKGLCQQLVGYSQHHVIKGLAQWSDKSLREIKVISNFTEVFGQGVSFDCDGEPYRIGKSSFCGIDSDKFNIVVTKRGEILAGFTYQEALQNGSEAAIAKLKTMGLSLGVLSGDKNDRVDLLSKELALDTDQSNTILGDLSPEDKARLIAESSASAAMVGNGINDSIALAKAHVSVAVKHANALAQKSADICLKDESLLSLVKAIQIARECRKAIIRAFSFALAFNISGVILGASGALSPVVAAVLMPFSSLTVILIASRWRPQ